MEKNILNAERLKIIVLYPENAAVLILQPPQKNCQQILTIVPQFFSFFLLYRE